MIDTPKTNTNWTQAQAIAMCITVESICTSYGCHVALTGGCLYRQGERKDLDLVLYRIRQCDQIDFVGLFQALEAHANIVKVSGFGFCHKATHNGKRIDFLSPEEEGGYEEKGMTLGELLGATDSPAQP